MLRNFQNFLKRRFWDLHAGLGPRRENGYKLLSQYVSSINMFRSIEEILSEAAKGIKEIINYDFFGFVLQREGRVTAWHNAHTNEQMFMKMINNDFPSQKIDGAFCLLTGSNRETFGAAGALPAPISCSAGDTAGSGRLYVIPSRFRLQYHQDVLQLMTKSLTNAIHNAMTMEGLKSLAVKDHLTECFNRTALAGYLEHSIANAGRYGSDLSLIIFDIDRFKEINDCYGHQAGDKVLRGVALAVLSEIRKSDCLARYGGDEFILLLPNTNLFVAVALAERLRKKISDLLIDAGEVRLSITASFGVSSLKQGAESSAVLREADERLYRSKAGGRNRVTPNAKIQSRQQTDAGIAL